MILVAGEALVDLLVKTDGTISAAPGGGPFNVARALARLGCPVTFLGRLSSDAFGEELRAGLVADGVALAVGTPTDLPTTLAVARLDGDGSASYRFYLEGTSAVSLTEADLAATVFDGVAAVHVGSLGVAVEPVASAVRELVRRTPDDALVMVDLNVRPAAIDDLVSCRQSLRGLLGRADVVKASAEDIEILWPGHDAAAAARELLTGDTAVVMVTHGPDPVGVFGRTFAGAVVVPEVAVVDTVGAGDAFGAGFLGWWYESGRGREGLADRDAVVGAVRRAAEVAALTCARSGADPPRRTDLPAAWSRPSSRTGSEK